MRLVNVNTQSLRAGVGHKIDHANVKRDGHADQFRAGVWVGRQSLPAGRNAMQV